MIIDPRTRFVARQRPIHVAKHRSRSQSRPTIAEYAEVHARDFTQMPIEIRTLGRIFSHSLRRSQRTKRADVYRQVHAGGENFGAGCPRR